MPERFSALIFDLDGTLVDSYEPIADSLNQVRAASDLPPKTLAEVRLEVGFGLESLIRDNVGADKEAEGVQIFRAHYRKVFRAGSHLMPGVGSVIDELRRRRIPMAITSNKPAYFSREIIDAVGLEGVFMAILGPEMVERPKPDPSMLDMAVDILAKPRDQILYVGDMTIDIETCRRARLTVAVIPEGSHDRETLVAANPDFLLERFSDLLALVGVPADPP